MKRFMRCLCMILAVVMVLATTAFATEVPENRASSFFMSSSVYLHKLTSVTFDARFDVTALHRMNELGASVVKIQRSADGVNWETTKTYTKESYSQLICENTVAHSAYIRYTGTKGYYYRARIDLYAKDSTGTGIMTEYTASIKLT